MRGEWLGIALLLGACRGGEVDCTTIAVASVSLSLLDPMGQPVTNADVRWSVDGGPEEPCESVSPGNYVCGWEVKGPIDLVVDAPGFLTEELTVRVEADECHVITREETLVLSPG